MFAGSEAIRKWAYGWLNGGGRMRDMPIRNER